MAKYMFKRQDKGKAKVVTTNIKSPYSLGE